MAWEPIVDKAIGNCENASWSLQRSQDYPERRDDFLRFAYRDLLIALERIDAARAAAPAASRESPASEARSPRA